MATKHRLYWMNQLDEREKGLIDSCRLYAENDPPGLPGHNLFMLVAKLAELLDTRTGEMTELPIGGE